MSQPQNPLGVPLMDEDHARLEDMFEAAATMDDAGLPAAFVEIRNELAAHLAREEKLMQAHDVPVLPCHVELHQALMTQAEAGQRLVDSGDLAGLRIHLASALPHLVAQHVATADTVSAGFIKGDMSGFACAS